MPVALIWVAARAAEPVATVTSVSVVAGQGIVGDRNYGQRKYPGRNLTLVEAEQIERFSQQCGAAIDLAATRPRIPDRSRQPAGRRVMRAVCESGPEPGAAWRRPLS